MANEVSKIKLPNDTTEYSLQDNQAIASITRSGTTFTATRRDGTSFDFTQQDNNTTYTFATGDNNGQIKVTPSGGTAQNVSVKGLGAAAYKGTTTSVTSGSSDLVTSGAVYTAIDNLPEPMVFKGSLGTGGTITTLPTASSANEGYTYKVITAGTYASQPAKVGDLFISNGTDWIWIPSGDESGTVTSITLKATSPIAIDSSSAITTSGTRTLSHANSGVTAGTYRSVTVNATGHVTAGTNPTTLSGYGITDAKIANGVITLGSNTITPLTSHQTVTDNNPTLAWGTKSKVATIGSTAINVTMPSNPNTDTKVTAVGNHYTPAEDSTAQLDADASSTTAATWNSTSLVTGVTVKRDAKGHVTGIAVDSIKMPANPNTNTTYTLGTSGNNITLTPSSGSAQSITAPYATSAGSATKATQDGSGNTITSTYVKKSGDTMTGELKLYREGTTTQNLGTYLTFQNKDTTTGKTSNGYIVGYDGGENGINLVINPAGNMFIGSGEAGRNHYDLYTHNTGENFYATSDTHMYLQANGQTIANRVGMIITNGHTIVPCKADVTTNNTGSIGTSSARWAGMYAMKYNGLLTGTGTAGQDKGSGTTNRYVPAKWTFNIGSNTVGEGDLFVIKLPVAGHDYGTYLSLNNGTNYYPVIYNTSTRLTSHFPASSCIIVTFDSAGSAGSIFPLNGGDARTTVSGGAFRVVDFYDSGNSTVNQTATTGNANYEVLFSGTADNTTRNEGARKSNTLLFNPSTGTLTTKVLTPNKTLADSWINCGKNPNIYINNTNAAPWITGNTKNGRIALCSYVSNDDKLYFNYWTNTTLAGTENKTDKQMIWDASTGTLTTATFVGALTGHASSDLALSGGTMTGNINFPAGKSIYSKDSANRNYALIYDNGNNLWIGATSSSGNHHTGSEGSTYISAGYNTTNSKGNNTIYVSVPTLTGSTWGHTAYAVLHAGNTSFTQSLSSGTKIGTIKINGTSTDLYCQTNTNTHRPIQVDGTEVLGNNTTALNLVAGTNVSLSNDGGTVTITATDTNNAVAITNTNPTTGTWYYPVWHSSTSATSTGVRANDGFRYYSLQGTTSAAGRSIMQVGNATQTGTAGNKYGEFRIYSQKQGYSTLTMASGATAERKHSLPDVAGTIGVFTATPTSGQVVVSDGTAGGFKTTGYTIAKSVPSNAVFTDTNTKVTTANDTSTNSNFRLLMAATADDTNREDTAKKNGYLWFNPSTQTFRVGDDSTGNHIINIGGSTVLKGAWGESDGTLSIYGKYYEAMHIYQKASTGADSYIQSHHNFNMGAHTLSNGTISSMTYTEGVTNTTGYIMHGRDTTQQYSCQWASSKLNFYVGTTNIGNISDRQLKSEIDEIDPKLLEAIAECKIYQYKAFNRDGLISVGIMAQDLVEKCEKRGIRPENYELLTKMNFIQGDDTLYYSVDYNQYATFMIDYLQKKVNELEEKIKLVSH